MKFGIVTFPGSNCDLDALHAVTDQLGQTAVSLWHREHDIQDCDVLILPGGFSYGDALRAGAIARFSPIMQEVVAHAERGAPVIGICNGFQILCESHLLPGALMRNAEMKFVCDWVHLRVEGTAPMFLGGYAPGQVLHIPIAHGEGRFAADEATLDALEQNGQVAFRYCDAAGAIPDSAIPNGAARGIAGITNAAGNVLGMMPHPERAVESLLGSTDGLPLFESLLARVGA
ncbi:MAG TPA: phosphoribosylformylglycinamidine synthase subunit PurQ [Gemmatimonadaceae bacterium]|nr:phosphoribosylformylglycinamidine synthase subunit PurQ [Gemmatimonadaceae bacterium]